MPTDAYCADSWKRSKRRDILWYREHLMPALLAAKENRVRDIDATIGIAQQLLDLYDEKVKAPTQVLPHEVEQSDDISLMKPVEPEVLDLLYGSTEKGAGEVYLKRRYKKPPEDRFHFRLQTSWDYGWRQKQSKMSARDVNHGRCAILRDTFYRKNNLAPDPGHYSQPAGAQFTVCSEYSCNFN
ncbi:uncharacterized protein LOC126978019 [Leptidea sinapis]|uniref:uncharacterized protein LOC126978019 n=1 Tax=Leptidea sinapis TaxID=189913 RepID=UPI0021C4784C|nr:uncharacterized protein LOC126978019 [Leptidea sinapis]